MYTHVTSSTTKIQDLSIIPELPSGLSAVYISLLELLEYYHKQSGSYDKFIVSHLGG